MGRVRPRTLVTRVCGGSTKVVAADGRHWRCCVWHVVHGATESTDFCSSHWLCANCCGPLSLFPMLTIHRATVVIVVVIIVIVIIVTVLGLVLFFPAALALLFLLLLLLFLLFFPFLLFLLVCPFLLLLAQHLALLGLLITAKQWLPRIPLSAHPCCVCVCGRTLCAVMTHSCHFPNLESFAHPSKASDQQQQPCQGNREACVGCRCETPAR